MSLKSAALEVTQARPGGVCAFVGLLAELDREDTVFLQELLDDQSNSHSYIGEVLRRDGHDLSDTTVGRHRNRKCRCGTR